MKLASVILVALLLVSCVSLVGCFGVDVKPEDRQLVSDLTERWMQLEQDRREVQSKIEEGTLTQADGEKLIQDIEVSIRLTKQALDKLSEQGYKWYHIVGVFLANILGGALRSRFQHGGWLTAGA